MKFTSVKSDQAVRRDDPTACAREPSLMPSEHVIKLLGSDEWALVIEALAMGDAQAAAKLERGKRDP
jgi:hypothetical protein